MPGPGRPATSSWPTPTARAGPCQRLGRELPGRPRRHLFYFVGHGSFAERDHGRHRRRPLRRRQADAAPADGGLSAQGQARRLLSAAPVHGRLHRTSRALRRSPTGSRPSSPEGITGGCGPGVYCPQNPVRRDQMAVFLLKAKYGSGLRPPGCTEEFDDVPCPRPFADWIEQLALEGDHRRLRRQQLLPARSNNTRGQMAVFIVRTFGLQ